jgi:protein SCO1/2
VASPKPTSIRGPFIILSIVGMVLLVSIGAVVLPWFWRAKGVQLERYGSVAPFELVDDHGRTFTDKDMRGNVVIANYVFTRCLTVCPTITSKMRRLQFRTEDRADLKLLSFTVDPEYDTPEVLAEYAKQFDADPARWRFITGDPDAMRRVVTDSMMQSMDKDGRQQADGTPNVAHSEYFVLFDKYLEIRGFYDSNDAPRMEKLMQHARSLLSK